MLCCISLECQPPTTSEDLQQNVTRVVTRRQLVQLFLFDRESENDILVARFCTERYGVKMYHENSRVRVDGVSIADVLKILLLPPL